MMPKLSEHSVVHKDRRFVVFGVSQEFLFEGYEMDYSILVFDKLYGNVVGFTDAQYFGHCNPGMYQESLPIKANNASELVNEVRIGLKAYKTFK